MQTNTAIAVAPSRRPLPIRLTAITTPAAPPVVVAPVRGLHPVYGHTPIGRDGFTLERQQLLLLNFWHKKASDGEDARAKELEAAGKQIDGDPVYDVFYECRWAIFEAAFKVDARRAGDVSALLQILSRHSPAADLEGVLTQERLNIIVAAAATAAAPIVPKKKMGALSKGRKLTRAGLLHRYQSFLVQELETVGWKLHGEPRFAFAYRVEDDAVNLRVKNRQRSRRRLYPFFDEDTLPRRARAVLQSLKIDTDRTTDPVTRKSHRGGSR